MIRNFEGEPVFALLIVFSAHGIDRSADHDDHCEHAAGGTAGVRVAVCGGGFRGGGGS